MSSLLPHLSNKNSWNDILIIKSDIASNHCWDTISMVKLIQSSSLCQLMKQFLTPSSHLSHTEPGSKSWIIMAPMIWGREWRQASQTRSRWALMGHNMVQGTQATWSWEGTCIIHWYNSLGNSSPRSPGKTGHPFLLFHQLKYSASHNSTTITGASDGVSIHLRSPWKR